MFWRFIFFVLCQFAGGIAGWYLVTSTLATANPLLGVLLGVVFAGLGWVVVNLVRAERLLAWLRAGDVSESMMSTGVWGEVSDRIRRLMRVKELVIRENKARLQDFLAALQASPNGVALLDSEGRFEWFNQMAGIHFGLDPQRDLLQQIGNLVRDPGFAKYFSNHDFLNELVMPGRESSVARPVKLSVQLHPYGEGRLLLLSRDVTALEQADAMRRDFVANVSHEIRTPLTVLSGFVETLQTLPLSTSERERFLTLMAQQADRMQTLVSDLLALSRLEGSPTPDTTDWTSVPTIMRQLEQEGHALSAALSPSSDAAHLLKFDSFLAGEIAGAHHELFSAMSNLVTNAIRYTPTGGEVQVQSLLLPDGRAEFSVRDTGPGIDEKHLPRLTERFYRVDRSRSRDTGGTGLGLAIVKHVAQRHGAELRIQSEPGKGSVFSIVFPASRVRAELATAR